MKKQAERALVVLLAIILNTTTLSGAMSSFTGEYSGIYKIKESRLELVNKDYNAYMKRVEETKRKEEEERKKKEQQQREAQKKKQQKAKESLWNVARFKITHYCSCNICNGKWTGQPTASGTMPVEGRTIAVDPRIIPLGTKVYIDGQEYVAEDTGSKIKGYIIDYYVNDHNRAQKMGVRYKDLKWRK